MLQRGSGGNRGVREKEEGREVEKGKNMAVLPGRGGGGVRELGYGNIFVQCFFDEVKKMFFLVREAFEDARIPFFPESLENDNREKVPRQFD